MVTDAIAGGATLAPPAFVLKLGVNEMLGWGEDFALGDSGIQMPPLWPAQLPVQTIFGRSDLPKAKLRKAINAYVRTNQPPSHRKHHIPCIVDRLMNINFDRKIPKNVQLIAFQEAGKLFDKYPGLMSAYGKTYREPDERPTALERFKDY